MLGLVDQSEDRAAKRRAQPDKGAHVDRGGRHQAGHKCQPRHPADACHLGCVHTKPGDQARREYRPPSASPQKARGALQRHAGMQRLRHSHQPVPAE